MSVGLPVVVDYARAARVLAAFRGKNSLSASDSLVFNPSKVATNFPRSDAALHHAFFQQAFRREGCRNSVFQTSYILDGNHVSGSAGPDPRVFLSFANTMQSDRTDDFVELVRDLAAKALAKSIAALSAKRNNLYAIDGKLEVHQFYLSVGESLRIYNQISSLLRSKDACSRSVLALANHVHDVFEGYIFARIRVRVKILFSSVSALSALTLRELLLNYFLRTGCPPPERSKSSAMDPFGGYCDFSIFRPALQNARQCVGSVYRSPSRVQLAKGPRLHVRRVVVSGWRHMACASRRGKMPALRVVRGFWGDKRTFGVKSSDG